MTESLRNHTECDYAKGYKQGFDEGLALGEARPVSMILTCPSCGERHIDEGEFATRKHHTHACQTCGMVWRPAIGPTFGVRFLPGFKNETTERRSVEPKGGQNG